MHFQDELVIFNVEKERTMNFQDELLTANKVLLAGMKAGQEIERLHRAPMRFLAKVLEIRDEGTFIPALAVDINPDNDAQRYLMRRCGYPCDGRPNIVLTNLNADGGKATNDPYAWSGRTYPVAHEYIIEHWESLKDGDVIDVSFILGETNKPKVSGKESQ